jgi:nicotinamidase/pyrazinamidase
MRTVFFDVDTQLDFLLPSGALYVPGAERLIPSLARLNRHAKERGFPLISTMDAHIENDDEFRHWPPHCVAGTLGQRKPESTLAGQMIIEKQVLDCFTVPRLREILAELGAQRYVVYGVVTEICVRYAAMGLLETGAQVFWVTDASQHLDPQASASTYQDFTARGGVLATLDQALA